MNRLLGIGFEPAGHWLLEDGILKVELIRHSARKNILYAFVCDGEVKYIGKTIRALSERMSGYKNPGRTQTTNINNQKRIKELLFSGVAVEILALPDGGLLHYGQFHLNLAAALEDSLIKVIDPEWNGGMVEGDGDMLRTAARACAPELMATQIFTFTLQPTYYKTGFFNVNVAESHHIGADGEQIEIYLGGASLPILGTINRRANISGTPRIMGGTGLRDWFKNSSVLKCVTVEVYSPTSIGLKVSKA